VCVETDLTVRVKPYVEVCHGKSDIVFVVDSSGSIDDSDILNWERVKNFTKSVVELLDIGRDNVRIGLVLFGNEAHIQFYLDSYYDVENMNAAIDRSKV
jgi:hypothetical protein